IRFQAADAEDEQIDGIGQQRKPDDHLIGAWAQQKPHAGACHDADAERENEFHQLSSAFGVSMARTRCLRTDWCASAMRISTVAPTTSENTPRSKNRALATGALPTSGIST